MTRRGGRGKGGDGFRRENKFGGNKRGKRNWEDRNEYHGGEEYGRQNLNWDRQRKNDNTNGGFRKFTGTNSMSPRGYKSVQQHDFNSRNYNNRNAWVHNQAGNRFTDNDEQDNHKDDQAISAKPSELVAPIEKPPQNIESIRLKLKTENPDQVATFPVQKSKQSKPEPEPSLNSESNSDKEDSQAVNVKTKEELNIIPKIKIKKEKVDKSRTEKKEVIKKDPPVARATQPSPSTESSSSESSSSSSSEDEVPQMPPPMRGGDIKPKKEKRSEDDVVCLGKMNKIENLVDNADSDDSTPQATCIVCSKPGHSSEECQMKCRKCSQSSYQCQMVCRNCGETYINGVQSFPKPPNPLIMFMQFMQFCMSQYSEMFTDNKFHIPQCDNSVHCPEPAPTVEVSRKDIENSKTNRKRNKSESKQSRKKARKTSQRNSDDDSDSSSMAASSSKKRKKRAKSVNREADPPPAAQPQASFGQHFGQSYPSNLPFPGSFNGPGYNPMLAFSQMMGYNPAGMNFSR